MLQQQSTKAKDSKVWQNDSKIKVEQP